MQASAKGPPLMDTQQPSHAHGNKKPTQYQISSKEYKGKKKKKTQKKIKTVTQNGK